MENQFATPAAFDRAIKKAARSAGGDAGEMYRQALRDRFLCRVFHGDNETFVLKGGSSLLARIPNARATRDIDFAMSERVSPREALKEMESVAAIDLGDWCTFRLTKCEESVDENGYSRLLKLRFASFVGQEEKDPVLIDLSLDCSTTLPPERIVPANRLQIGGLEVCDYLIYPLPDQLADKLCAIMEKQPGGYPSSRMKDLVDVVTYITNRPFDLRQVKGAVRSECAKREMDVPKKFEAPSFWRKQFARFAKKCNAPREYESFEESFALAACFFDAVLSDSDDKDALWSDGELRWIYR